MLLLQRLIDWKEHTRTPEELAFLKLQSKQEVLNDQLRSLNNRREELVGDIGQRTGADLQGVEARLRQVDAQILQVEKDLATVTQEVAAAAPASISDHVRTEYRGFGEEDMVGAGFIGAGIMFTLFLPFLWRSFRRRRHVAPGPTTTQTQAIGSERIERMEMAIDSIAVEMERVSENQRFMTRLMTETQLAGTIAAVRGSTEAARMAAEKSNG